VASASDSPHCAPCIADIRGKAPTSPEGQSLPWYSPEAGQITGGRQRATREPCRIAPRITADQRGFVCPVVPRFSDGLRGIRAAAEARGEYGKADVIDGSARTVRHNLAMSSQSDADREEQRRRFVAGPDALAALSVEVEQLSDPDVRSLVIRHEHPEFEEALKEAQDEIEGPGGPMNPRLHLAMHEIVASQLWEDSPPEVWATAARLLEEGYERHEILHMLGRLVSDQVWEGLHDARPYDRERHVAALRALPGSWERERTARRAAGRHDDGRKQARRAARAARRRNRRPR